MVSRFILLNSKQIINQQTHQNALYHLEILRLNTTIKKCNLIFLSSDDFFANICVQFENVVGKLMKCKTFSSAECDDGFEFSAFEVTLVD